MRTQAQMLTRKRATRVVSVALIAMGAMTLLTTALSAGELARTAFLGFGVAALWFVAAGAFVGLSRIWGELADRAEPDRDKS